MSKENSCLARQLMTYPSIRNHKVVIAWAASQGLSKSEAINKMIGFYIDSNFSLSQQNKFILSFDELNETEKRFTHKKKED